MKEISLEKAGVIVIFTPAFAVFNFQDSAGGGIFLRRTRTVNNAQKEATQFS